jgi:hypothetical protein
MKEHAMRNRRKLGAVLATAALAGGTYFATAASASTPNSPDTATTASATTPARVFAAINADGTKLRGKAVASTAHLSTGTYDIRFNRNISTCAWTATVGIGSFGGSTGPAIVTATGRAGTNNGLFVNTYNTAGTLTDEAFLVVVVCS